MSIQIRPAIENDLSSFVDIINYYIQHTAITFDTDSYDIASRSPWMHQFKDSGPHQCLTALEGDEIIGYACSAPFRPKNAYLSSVEVSVYLTPEYKGKGLGQKLYEALFQRLSSEAVHRAYALITLPNERSISLHSKFGFEQVGVLSDAGYKLGQYHSISLMEKQL